MGNGDLQVESAHAFPSVSSEKSVVTVGVSSLKSDPQPTLGLSEYAQLTQGRRSCLTPTLGFAAESLRDTARQSGLQTEKMRVMLRARHRLPCTVHQGFGGLQGYQRRRPALLTQIFKLNCLKTSCTNSSGRSPSSRTGGLLSGATEVYRARLDRGSSHD